MNRTQLHSSRSPEHDLELLSAYLDNQLSLAERVNLERRLEQEPPLRDALAELRATAMALRSLEPLRPSRSFTLDPATVRRPRPLFPLAWVMQLGSGLAGMLLVMLATVQLLAAPSDATMVPMTAMATAPATAPMPEAAPAAEMRLEATAAGAASGMAPTEADAAAAPMTTADAPVGAASAPTEADAAAVPMTTADAPVGAESAPAESDAAASSMSTADTPVAQEPAGGAAATEAPAEPFGAAVSDESAPAPSAQPSGGLAPGFTLALGVALMTLGLTWHLVSRRRV